MSNTGNVRLPQSGETPLHSLTTPFGTIRYLYSRSADSVEQHTSGQDFLAFRYDDKRVTFALCDGVSQSFMGELAARFVGDRLIAWLWEYSGPSDPVAFGTAAQLYLNRLPGEAEHMIAQHPLPDDLPDLTREALESQRAYGSEAMFVAGRTDLKTNQVILCWLGDSTIRALDPDGQIVNTGSDGTTAERWSSSQGVKGKVHAWRGSTQEISRLVAHSDGIETTTVIDALGTHGLLQQQVNKLQGQPSSDDVSMLDLNLKPEEPAFRPIEIPGQPQVPRQPIAPPPPSVPQVEMRPIKPIAPPAPSVEGWRQIEIPGGEGEVFGVLILWRIPPDVPPGGKP